jgi:tRNA (mo5U34)-methyltransferase
MDQIILSVKDEVRKLAPWFHNIHLPDGTQTAPDHDFGDFPKFKWEQISPFIPGDLTGKKVLDIGCNAGFYSIELAKKGADVLGIDLDPHYLKQAKWVIEQFGLSEKIRLMKMQVYDLSKINEEFDMIWFMGVFYHLRYPMLAMDIISQKTKEVLVFQTLTMPGEEIIGAPEDLKINSRELMLEKGWPKMAFIEKKLAGDPTNWWAPNRSCIEAMLRTCGFKITAKPGHEIFICEKDADGNSVITGWNESEYYSAIGSDWEKVLDKKVSR